MAYCATPLAFEHFKLIVEARGVGVVGVLRRTAGVQKHRRCCHIAPHRRRSKVLELFTFCATTLASEHFILIVEA
ncbi:MAG: hypothetical protein J6X22_06185, partial [Muribaculaceae bacterium]|nr:hypothetical protein [Muribaculaceae bacterium]